MNDDQMLLMSRIAEETMNSSQEQTKVKAARVFAILPNTSVNLISQLAVDSYGVADPVLQNSQLLSDDDLVYVIKTNSDEHRLSIAKRDNINPFVTDSLIEYGNDVHLITLAKNMGARFSVNGFSILAEKATQESLLCEALSYRGDMPVEVAISLMAHLSMPLTVRLRGTIETTQNVTLAPRSKKQMILAREQTKFSNLAKDCIEAVLSGRKTANECTLMLCAEDKAKDLCQFIAGIAELNEGIVSGALFKVNGTKLTQICKMIDLSNVAFEEIAMLRLRRMRLPLSQAKILCGQYEVLAFASAQRAIRALHGSLNNTAMRLEQMNGGGLRSTGT
ncbi:MAG: DUF2336 domain-containing protein [Pseudomonadota bacterium]